MKSLGCAELRKGREVSAVVRSWPLSSNWWTGLTEQREGLLVLTGGILTADKVVQPREPQGGPLESICSALRGSPISGNHALSPQGHSVAPQMDPGTHTQALAVTTRMGTRAMLSQLDLLQLVFMADPKAVNAGPPSSGG